MKKTTMPELIIPLVMLAWGTVSSSPADAQTVGVDEVKQGVSRHPKRSGEMQLFAGFGEIPFSSDSFKPAVGLSYRRSFWELGVSHQFEDRLRRDGESFNADFGQLGLTSATEKTGSRSMLQLKIFPGIEWFYVTAGLMHSDGDVERIAFSLQPRSIGMNTYDTSLIVGIERRSAVRPVAGFGFRVAITKKLQWTTDFSMDWFGGVPSPEIRIAAAAAIEPSDSAALEQRIRENYENNFHNRYHVFSTGLQYRF